MLECIEYNELLLSIGSEIEESNVTKTLIYGFLTFAVIYTAKDMIKYALKS